MNTIAEENYLKAILQIQYSKSSEDGVGTNEIASLLHLKPATVNDMLKKLHEKNLVHYEKYGKSFLTPEGTHKAVYILRKHRLWETFLYEKLEFTWDEVHEVAEQLEHINSNKLMDKIDEILGFPEFDPHGEVIPNKLGEYKQIQRKTLNEVNEGQQCIMVAVKDNTASFLQYMNKLGLGIKNTITVVAKNNFDDSIEIEVNGKTLSISDRFARNLLVMCIHCDRSQSCQSMSCNLNLK